MKKFFCSGIFTMFILCWINGQDIRLPLWSDNIPNYQFSGEVEIVDSSDVVRISLVQNPDLAVFLPSKKNANQQAVIICPGGGYMRLSYDWEGTDIAKWFNANGIAAIVLKYRLPDSKSNIIRYMSPLLDVRRAVRMVRYHAASWNIDANKIGVMGFSAGGHLASTLGTQFDYGNSGAADEIEKISCRPDFMILMYPVISMDSSITHKGTLHSLLGEKPDPKLVQLFSNELQVKEDSPPTFIVHSMDDKAVPVENSLRFYSALREKNISCEMHLYPTGGHGFSFGFGKGHLETWTDRCIDWLKWINQN